MSDESDFREWALASHRRLLHFAKLVSGDHGRAEDLLQDALIRTFAAWPRLASGNPDAYARRCIINRRIDWWRRGGGTESPYDDPPTPAGGDFSLVVDQQLIVLAALRRLTKRERTVIAMRFWLGLTESQIADELKIAVGTVKSTTARAVGKLRNDATLGEDRSDEPVR